MSSVFNVPHTPPTATDTSEHNFNHIDDHGDGHDDVNKTAPQQSLLIWPPKTRSCIDQNKPTAALMQPNSGRPPAANTASGGGGGGRGADVVPTAQPNLRANANNGNVMAASSSNLLPPLSSMGAAKNPVKAAFRLGTTHPISQQYLSPPIF